MRGFRQVPVVALLLTLSMGLLQGCGGSTDPELNIGPDLSLSALQVSLDPPTGKILLRWSFVEGATRYKIFLDENGESDGELTFTQVDGDILASDIPDGDIPFKVVDVIVHKFDWRNARFMLQSCVDDVCEEIGQQIVATVSPASIGNFQTSLTGFNAAFGFSVSLAEAGDRIVIGAPGTSVFACEEIFPVPEDDIDEPCQYDETTPEEDVDDLVLTETFVDAGAVTILALNEEGIWDAEALIRSPNRESGDAFGSAVEISADGTTIAVAAPREDSAATTVDGDMDNNDAVDSGAVYIFRRGTEGEGDEEEVVWNFKAYLKASNAGGDVDDTDNIIDGDLFGGTMALSGDGSVLAVAAVSEDSAAMAIDGDGSDNSAENSGAVYVFRSNFGNWSQQAYIKAFNSNANDFFGGALAINDSGDRLAVGAINESSADGGINPDGFNDAAQSSGAVYVYDWAGSAWAQQAFIKASDTGAKDEFGRSVALNGSGDVLAVGSPQEDSKSRGVGGDPTNNNSQNSGAAYLFEFDGNAWAQTEFFKASNADAVDELGFSVALNKTGDNLIATAIREGGPTSGIDGGQKLDFLNDSGAAYLFVRDGAGWAQETYIKGAVNSSGNQFGFDSDFGLDGDALVISARGGNGSVFLY